MTNQSLLKGIAIIWLGSLLVNGIATLVKDTDFVTTMVNGIEIPIGFSVAWVLLWLGRRSLKPKERDDASTDSRANDLD
jgi:hypothetical protein